MEEYISIQSISNALGRKDPKGNFVSEVRRRFPQLCSKRRINHTGHLNWCIPLNERESLISMMGYSSDGLLTPKNEFKNQRNYERECAAELEQRGFTVIVTKEKGTPDVIAFRKRESGGFDLVFREAKGPTDAVHKEQLEFRDRMRDIGVDAEFQWF